MGKIPYQIVKHLIAILLAIAAGIGCEMLFASLGGRFTQHPLLLVASISTVTTLTSIVIRILYRQHYQKVNMLLTLTGAYLFGYGLVVWLMLHLEYFFWLIVPFIVFLQTLLEVLAWKASSKGVVAALGLMAILMGVGWLVDAYRVELHLQTQNHFIFLLFSFPHLSSLITMQIQKRIQTQS
jgi:hypothetical protein